MVNTRQIRRKNRKQVPARLKALLQKEIGSICPFCRNEDVGHFEVHHIDGNPANNEISNLLMVCRICHSKITKGDITKADVHKKKNYLEARARSGAIPPSRKSIFTAREDLEFEYVRSSLDYLTRAFADQIVNTRQSAPKPKGYWDVRVSVLELLLMCYADNPVSLGMYDSWEKDREAILEHQDGDEIRFRLAMSSDLYDPIPRLIKYGLVSLKRDWNGHYNYTKKMHRFVHWIEYNQLKPKVYECEYKEL